jgi:hypothetical protein
VLGSALRITPLEHQTFGARVSGVQLARLTECEFAAISRAACRYGVLAIGSQEMSPDEHVAFARRFPHSRVCDEQHFCGPLAKEGFIA